MNRINDIQLDPSSREEIAQAALKHGTYKTAESFGINPKTAFLWRKRLREGKGFRNKAVPPISAEEKIRILMLAREEGVGTINLFIQKHDINRSLAALYNLFVRSRLRREIIKIVNYSCNKCSDDFRTVALYWGIPTKTVCPGCGGILSIEQSYPLSFLGKADELYSIRRNKLMPLTFEELCSLRESHAPLKSHYPKYIDLAGGSELSTHLLKSIGKDSNLFLCGLHSPASRNVHPYSAQSGIPVDCVSLCPECVEKANLLLSKGKSIKPIIMRSREDKGEMMREIITVGILSGNISKTCEAYGISRSTFYNNLKKFKQRQPGVFGSISQSKTHSQKAGGKSESVDRHTLSSGNENRAR